MELNDPGLFRQQCYIGGAWVDAEDGATFEVTDPADGAPLGTVPKMGAAETRRAIFGCHARPPRVQARRHSSGPGYAAGVWSGPETCSGSV